MDLQQKYKLKTGDIRHLICNPVSIITYMYNLEELCTLCNEWFLGIFMLACMKSYQPVNYGVTVADHI